MGSTMNITISQRGKSFRLRIETRDEANKRVFAYETFKTEKDAVERKEHILSITRGDNRVRITDDTVQEYINHWIAKRQKFGMISETSAENYTNTMKPFLARFGGLKMVHLEDVHIERFYMQRLETVSSSTVRMLHLRLKTIFANAVEAGDLMRNPMSKVVAPRANKESRLALTEQQMQALLVHVADKPLVGFIVRLALGTGMRRGEIAALRWSDVDLAAKQIHIKRSRVRLSGFEIEQAPKSRAGVRTISIPAGLHAELLERVGEPHKRVVDNISLVYLTELVNDALKAIGCGAGFSLHSLRHTHATHLLRLKMPVKAVSQRLGHADVNVTLSVYSHVMRGDDADLADAIDQLMTG